MSVVTGVRGSVVGRRQVLDGLSRASRALAAKHQPSRRPKDRSDDDGAGHRHIRGIEAAKTRQARATAKTAPRCTFTFGFRQGRRPCTLISSGLPRSTCVISSCVASASLTRYTRLGMKPSGMLSEQSRCALSRAGVPGATLAPSWAT